MHSKSRHNLKQPSRSFARDGRSHGPVQRRDQLIDLRHHLLHFALRRWVADGEAERVDGVGAGGGVGDGGVELGGSNFAGTPWMPCGPSGPGAPVARVRLAGRRALGAGGAVAAVVAAGAWRAIRACGMPKVKWTLEPSKETETVAGLPGSRVVVLSTSAPAKDGPCDPVAPASPSVPRGMPSVEQASANNSDRTAPPHAKASLRMMNGREGRHARPRFREKRNT